MRILCHYLIRDYNVVMAHPISVRFQDEGVIDEIKAEARASGTSVSALAEELITEGLRVRRHPLVNFRPGSAGRRPGLIGGPDIWELVDWLVGGEVPPEDRVERTATHLRLRTGQVEAALAYYAEFTEEIDAWIRANDEEAERAESLWRREQELLAR